MKLDKIGKFLSAVLETTDALLREIDYFILFSIRCRLSNLMFASFFFQFPKAIN